LTEAAVEAAAAELRPPASQTASRSASASSLSAQDAAPYANGVDRGASDAEPSDWPALGGPSRPTPGGPAGASAGAPDTAGAQPRLGAAWDGRGAPSQQGSVGMRDPAGGSADAAWDDDLEEPAADAEDAGGGGGAGGGEASNGHAAPLAEVRRPCWPSCEGTGCERTSPTPAGGGAVLTSTPGAGPALAHSSHGHRRRSCEARLTPCMSARASRPAAERSRLLASQLACEVGCACQGRARPPPEPGAAPASKAGTAGAAGEDDDGGLGDSAGLFDEAPPDQWAAPAPAQPAAAPVGPWGGYSAGPKRSAKLKGKGAAPGAARTSLASLAPHCHKSWCPQALQDCQTEEISRLLPLASLSRAATVRTYDLP